MEKKYGINGFTLIELVVVIAVIGLLMSFVVPSVQNVMMSAKKSSAQNSLQQIINAYIKYRNEYGDLDNTKISGIIDWAEIMAQYGLLNDPHAYVFQSDAIARAINAPESETIVHSDGKTSTNCWRNNTGVSQEDGWSVNIITGDFSKSINASTTPVAFTRGLQADGTWSNTGVFGTKGGFIAFLDGSVKWYTAATNLLSLDLTKQGVAIKNADGSNGDAIHSNWKILTVGK